MVLVEASPIAVSGESAMHHELRVGVLMPGGGNICAFLLQCAGELLRFAKIRVLCLAAWASFGLAAQPQSAKSRRLQRSSPGAVVGPGPANGTLWGSRIAVRAF